MRSKDWGDIVRKHTLSVNKHSPLANAVAKFHERCGRVEAPQRHESAGHGRWPVRVAEDAGGPVAGEFCCGNISTDHTQL